MKTALLAALWFVPCSTLAAQKTQASPFPPRAPGRLFVSGYDSHALHAYRAWDGAPRGQAAGVPGAQSIVLGRDGLLYVCAEKIDQVVRVDPATKGVLGAFVQDDPLTPADENGPLDGPTAAVFGPGGDLYVASFETDEVLRFDGVSAAYEGVFVSAGLGGLDGPDAGTKFGPDGLLYVPSFWNDRVLRYDAEGAFVDEFVSFREGTLRQPRDLVLHGGVWYVASSLNDRILRYDLAGNPLGTFATVNQPYSLKFHLDEDLDAEDLYVVSLASDSVRRFDGESGAARGALVLPGAGGVDGAVFLFFMP